MAMTQEKFDALAAHLEKTAESNPSAYRLRVYLLAALGYVYIVFVLAVLVFLIGFLVLAAVFGKVNYVSIKLGIGLVVLASMILRALWVRLPEAEGLALSPGQATPLFETVEQIRETLKGPKVHRVLLTDAFNASIAQIPRLGLFGWYRNYLTVGLPLMQALSPQQFRSVLAHEFGHLSGAHGRSSSWIYRIRRTWYQLMEALQQERHWGSFIFRRFFEWYAPFFGAYSFVLARANEYEADRYAADLAGAKNAADALLNTTIKGAYLEKSFWPDLYKKADSQADAPSTLYTTMHQALRVDLEPDQAGKWLEQSLARKTGSEDTHPSLADRLAAIGQEARLPETVCETAAQQFLGESLAELAQSLNDLWHQNIAPSWKDRYEYVRKSKKTLKGLEEKAAREPLTLEEARQRAWWTEEFQGSEAALPLYREILEMNPDDAGALYASGRIQLSQDRPEGIDSIERAMTLDTEAILPGSELIYNFLMENGKPEEAQTYYKRAVEHAGLLNLARAERSQLGFKETYLHHGLSDEQVEHLKQQVARYPQVAEAYLVRKKMEYFPEKPLYALGLVIPRPWSRYRSGKEDLNLSRKLAQEMQFPGETLVLVLSDSNRKMKKIMRKIAGSQIYRRA